MTLPYESATSGERALREALAAPPAAPAPAVPNDSKLADAHLAALLRYTGNFYGVAMERGLPAGQTANMVAHVESAARALHKMALSATPPTAPAVPLTEEQITKALRRAFSLGQTYWQQADSDSYKQNAKSDETRQKFETLIAETLNGITGGGK